MGPQQQKLGEGESAWDFLESSEMGVTPFFVPGCAPFLGFEEQSYRFPCPPHWDAWPHIPVRCVPGKGLNRICAKASPTWETAGEGHAWHNANLRTEAAWQGREAWLSCQQIGPK